MLGEADAVRYRILATTDATPQSVVDRLPSPEEMPRPITETTHILNHAGAPRSITAASSASTPPELVGIRETRIADPELEGLQSALKDAIADFANRNGRRRPADVRVGIDSLKPLLDNYSENVVRRCLRTVGERVREYNAMAHYVLPEPYESDHVQTLATEVDAVVELRTVDPVEYGYEAEQRWHVPNRDLTMDWIPL